MFVFKPQIHYDRRPPAVCPRFLSHMKARPEDFHPPCYLNNNHQQQLPSEGRMQRFNLPPASQTDFLLGKLIKPSGAFTPAASHSFCSPLSSQHGGHQVRHWILIPAFGSSLKFKSGRMSPQRRPPGEPLSLSFCWNQFSAAPFRCEGIFPCSHLRSPVGRCFAVWKCVCVQQREGAFLRSEVQH